MLKLSITYLTPSALLGRLSQFLISVCFVWVSVFEAH